MYVAVKGGEEAIRNSRKLISETRRGDHSIKEMTLDQIDAQFGLAVDRVMSEGSLFDRKLAALALKQAQGDAMEAIFLLRAYRTTLPRIASSSPLDTSKMSARRRISATFKDLPGGQILGPTYDYTHRLMDFALAAEDLDRDAAEISEHPLDPEMPQVVDLLNTEGLIEAETPDGDDEPFDLTRQPISFPAGRDQRLQNLARADEGFLLAMAASSVRGYGYNHPFVGELRLGEVRVEIVPEELGFPIEVAEVSVTECQMVNGFRGTEHEAPKFTRGYGLSFGHNERKVMAMALVDRALKAPELGEDVEHPVQDAEFILPHSDNIDSNGLITHYKLPHYVDFQAELQVLRKLRAEFDAAHQAATAKESAK